MLRSLYHRWPRLRAAARSLKDAVAFHLVQATIKATSPLSLDSALAAADWLGDLAYLLLRQTRRMALDHLALVFGDKLDPAARREIVRLGMRDFAKSFCEIAKFDEVLARLEDYCELHGWEDIEDSLDRGAIVCAGHIGNWELLAAYIAQTKDIRVAAVARQLDEPRLNQMLVDVRARGGVETILRESPSAGRQILKILKDHGLLAMVIDQDTKVPSITVPFLGRPARTPVAPAALAVRRNLPIVVAYSFRKPSGGLRLVFEKPLWPDASMDREPAIRDLTRRINDGLSQAILAHPTQWPWWHRRWRRPPQPQLDPDAGIL